MSGLDGPRGLAFGPDGGLYVAEAGRGGDGPSIVLRPGVVASYGPSGAVSRWLDGQQADRHGPAFALCSGRANGPQDISFHGSGDALRDRRLRDQPGAACRAGEAGAGFAQLVRLQPNGEWQNVSDIGANELAVNPGGGPSTATPTACSRRREARSWWTPVATSSSGSPRTGT